MPKHIEELDGCDHGHTGKACKPDPQPLHGAECLTHGQHGGVNEDHCAATPTTTTTTTLTLTTTSTVPSLVSTTTAPSTEASPSTPTFLAPSAPLPAATSTLVGTTPAPLGELPHTGLVGDLIPFGLGFVLLGVALRRAARRG